MTDINEIVAESLWLLPGIAYLREPWDRWKKIAPDECDRKMIDAGRLIRLLSERGVVLTQSGADAVSMPPPTHPVIWRYRLSTGVTERIVRKGAGDLWDIVMIDGGEHVEHSFTLPLAHEHAGMVLMGDPDSRKIPSLGKELAAATEIYRLSAESLGCNDE